MQEVEKSLLALQYTSRMLSFSLVCHVFIAATVVVCQNWRLVADKSGLVCEYGTISTNVLL